MRELVEGKTVAVVGRAASLIGSGNGPAIDACEVVVRVNWTLPPAGDAADIGSRTDLLYHCAGCEEQSASAAAAGVPTQSVDRALRKKLARASGASPRQFRPTTGVVAIHHALQAGAEQVSAFGFDVYTTGYVDTGPPPGPRPVGQWQHSAGQERRLLRMLSEREPRFRPDATLIEALA